ncbi:unnamed protein product [Adineta steineri]|uniref:EGF-like calcium-binding domain-containing protein n=1 Tax=Adineta steineri TaxID=433720 RepID=A0A815UHQ4_9BILA|nr:unnamed protein product [Adineta steineri]CAF1650840.1 unnamed protein product [Adineta steineri]
MIIKSTVYLTVTYLIFLKVSYGYLGCPNNLVPCRNKTHCIEIKEVCIDYHDCVNNDGDEICHHLPKNSTDSIACVTHIDPQVSYDRLSPHDICNGHQDCFLNEDEGGCNKTICQVNHWLCKKGSCIENFLVCDGQKDCPDGSDEEEGVGCHHSVCGPNKIHCPTGQCIDEVKMCDGIAHCLDGFDEKNCTHTTSTIASIAQVDDSCPEFTCSTSGTFNHPICLSNDRVCDGYNDCPGGDDEHNCRDKCTIKSNCPTNSDVSCIQHPAVGQLCRCVKQGYRLTTKTPHNNIPICQDYDECNDSLGTYCSFKCTNTDGSFNCTCPSNFTLDKVTKTCQRSNDQSKPNLLILSDRTITFYNMLASTEQYSSQQLNTINIDKSHHFDYIQYDHKQMFVIYYDQIQHAILCESNRDLKTIVLLTNLTVNAFAYNANEKILFIIENQSKTLRMYTSIVCDVSINIPMHSWSLNDNNANSIHSMEIDVYNRQLIFASNSQFMISNMSEPNVIKIVHKTDREIKRFIYDAAFQRIFWTADNIDSNGLSPVFTCNGEFKQCHDTSIRIPSASLFAFFNDGLLYIPSSKKSLDFIRIYGKNRFSGESITSTHDQIRSFVFIDNQQTEGSDLCMKYSTARCKNYQLCLQINSINMTCLSIDGSFLSKQATTDIDNSMSQDALKLSVGDNSISPVESQQKTHRYRPSNAILIGIITLGILVTILAFFVKRCHNRFIQKASRDEQSQNERRLIIDPSLDEFTIVTDDRVSKKHIDYARDILIENPSFLLLGRRRDSI